MPEIYNKLIQNTQYINNREGEQWEGEGGGVGVRCKI